MIKPLVRAMALLVALAGIAGMLSTPTMAAATQPSLHGEAARSHSSIVDRGISPMNTLTDNYPCTYGSPYPSLPYACPIAWRSDNRVPVYASRTGSSAIVDYLHTWSGTQYFQCDNTGAT